MDPALLREREAFKKRAMQLPTVEKRKAKPESGSSKPSKRPKHASAPKPKEPASDFNYKAMQGSSQYKFSVLAKIVKHMKTRHLEGDFFPITIDEILDETNQLDISIRLKQWLATEALMNNPKIDVVEGDKYKFKPKYNIKDRKSLLRFLDKKDQQGLGGIYIEDIEEAVPRAQKVMRILNDQIITVTRPIDKKQIVFYNDKQYQFTVDEEIQKLWRSVAVDSVDENKIAEYLDKQGISSIHDVGIKKVVPGQKRKLQKKKRNHKFKTHNEHMGDLLQDYSDKS